MVSTWQWRRIGDASELEAIPPGMTPQEAQQWCNFIVWIPGRGHYEVGNATVRKEAPPGRTEGVTAGRTPWTSNNPSAYRYEVQLPSGRIRVKEFLYDWAFPATDHPSLWRSKVKPLPLKDEYVVWFGKNYYGQRAASARLARTMIEAGVIEGDVSEEELLAFFRSLQPVDEIAASSIMATHFSRLSYWARYNADLVGVPTGLWAFQREPGPSEEKWHEDINRVLRQLDLPVSLGEFVADDVATFDDGHGNVETEVCYVAGPDRGHELRLVAQRHGQGRLVNPPTTEPHPHDSEAIEVVDTKVRLAWESKKYGSFDAVWYDNKRDQERKLVSTTGVGLGYIWFMHALKLLIED